MSKSGIYQILNLTNGHRYVGSAVSLTRRWSVHRSDFRKGTNSPHLQRAWNKYGEDAFEFRVIGTCAKEDLKRMEQHLLDDLRPEYNISPTAGSPLGVTHSPETRDKVRLARIGKTHSPEARANMSAAQKGKTLSPEARAARIGRTASSEARANMSAAQKGNKNALGNKNRLGIKQTPETRAKISAALKRYWAAQRPADGGA